MFLALENAKKLVELTTDVIEVLKEANRNLADQIDRASTSVLLNLAEGNRRTGADRLKFFRYAEGSAAEVESILFSIRARRIRIDLTELDPVVTLQLKLLYRLTRSVKLGAIARPSAT